MRTNPLSNKQLRRQLKRWKRAGEHAGSPPSGSEASDSADFDHAVQKQELRQLEGSLEELVQQLTRRGQTLVDSPTPSHLNRYKQALSSFLKQALRLSRGIERLTGRRNLPHLREGEKEKEHVVVVTLDDQLSRLTRQVIEAQDAHVDVADQVGEIRGLVVDLVSSLSSRVP